MRVNSTSNSPRQNVLTLAEQIRKNGGDPDIGFCSHETFTAIVNDLGTNVQYKDSGNAAIGVSGIEVRTSGGVVDMYPDPDCPANRMYVLTKNSWYLHHLNGFPQIVSTDGKVAQRQASIDGIEIRCRYYAQLVCKAPGHNGVAAV